MTYEERLRSCYGSKAGIEKFNKGDQIMKLDRMHSYRELDVLDTNAFLPTYLSVEHPSRRTYQCDKYEHL